MSPETTLAQPQWVTNSAPVSGLTTVLHRGFLLCPGTTKKAPDDTQRPADTRLFLLRLAQHLPRHRVHNMHKPACKTVNCPIALALRHVLGKPALNVPASGGAAKKKGRHPYPMPLHAEMRFDLPQSRGKPWPRMWAHGYGRECLGLADQKGRECLGIADHLPPSNMPRRALRCMILHHQPAALPKRCCQRQSPDWV